MRQRKTFLLLSLVAAILLICIGYAAIQDVTLNITGTATVTSDQSNFKVAFTGIPTYTGTGTPVLEITGDTTATMSVTDLVTVGDTVTANFTIANTSSDITAYLSSSFINSNTEYFKVTTSLDSTELAPKTGTTILKITVELIKAPVTENQTGTISVEVIASPTAPAKIISFTIDGTTYYAEEGMIWGEWVNETNYNVDGFSSIMSNMVGYEIISNDGGFFCVSTKVQGYPINADEKIISETDYVTTPY